MAPPVPMPQCSASVFPAKPQPAQVAPKTGRPSSGEKERPRPHQGLATRSVAPTPHTSLAIPTRSASGTSRKRKQEHRAARDRAKAKGQIRTVTLAELETKKEANALVHSPEATDQTNFDHVPVEAATTIHDRRHLVLERFDVQWQSWAWEGVAGETAVFIEAQLGNTDTKALQALVRRSEQLAASGPTTVTRQSTGYAFVNFNFQT